MRILFILAFIFSSMLIAKAQKSNSFSVKLNEKNIIINKSIPESNAIECTYTKANIKAKNALVITIKEKIPNAEWHREFTITDKNGNELNRSIQKTTSGVFGISLVLPSGFKGVVKIITITIPNDPNIAATMRLKSYNLANITVK